MASSKANGKPAIALAIGDPAGVGPELAAKLIADPDEDRTQEEGLIVALRRERRLGVKRLRHELRRSAQLSPV